MSKRDTIVAAARERFFYYGIAKTTMQEIAADVDLAVGTLYLYFRNKDDLVVACADEFIERHRSEAEAILAADLPADEKLRRYIVGRFRTATEMRTGSRHAAELARTVLRLKPDRLLEEGLMMWNLVTRVLEQGMGERLLHVANPQQDAKVFIYSVACFFPNALGEPLVPPREEDLLEVVEWFLGVWKRGTKPAKAHKRGGDSTRASGDPRGRARRV